MASTATISVTTFPNPPGIVVPVVITLRGTASVPLEAFGRQFVRPRNAERHWQSQAEKRTSASLPIQAGRSSSEPMVSTVCRISQLDCDVEHRHPGDVASPQLPQELHGHGFLGNPKASSMHPSGQALRRIRRLQDRLPRCSPRS